MAEKYQKWRKNFKKVGNAKNGRMAGNTKIGVEMPNMVGKCQKQCGNAKNGGKILKWRENTKMAGKCQNGGKILKWRESTKNGGKVPKMEGKYQTWRENTINA